MDRSLLLLIGFVISLQLYSQDVVRHVEGQVIDVQSREPIAYASIGIEGYPIGTSSNADGFFSLKIPASIIGENIALKVSCIGYENYRNKNVSENLLIELTPSSTVLREVVVFGKEMSAERIVKRAFSNVKKNYASKPFILNTFYRHYCKDDSLYGRLIEAAVELYKPKGYKATQRSPGQREEMRVNQLRRSYDNTKVNVTHVPIAISNVLAADVAAYQYKSQARSAAVGSLFNMFDVSMLRYHADQFEFELEGTTTYDGSPVYIISYSLKPNQSMRTIDISGKLYIASSDYAFVKSEYNRKTKIDTIATTALYKKWDGKYYLYHALKEGKNKFPRLDFIHKFHIEMITTGIQTSNLKPFKGKHPTKDDLLKIDFDSVFWNSYNILKATPLEERIVRHLEERAPLQKQYQQYVEEERERHFSGQADEERFNTFVLNSKGRVIFIDVWASWCAPCINEFRYSKKIVDDYKHRVAFVFLSIDDSIDRWQAALKSHDLIRPYFHHFRIGPQAAFLNALRIEEIPRYILIDKRGRYHKIYAPRPSDPQLLEQLNELLAEVVGK